MHKIGNVIDTFFSDRGLTDMLIQQQILLKWPEIVGKKISVRTRAERIENGVLRIKVDDSVWINHLMLLKPEIILKINRYFNENVVRDLFLNLGTLEGKPEKGDISQPVKKEKFKELTREEKEEIKDLVDELPEQNIVLKKKIERILKKFY